MPVVVFGSDVLIGFLNREDAHHGRAIERVETSLAPGHRRLLCAVNHAEIMTGPIRAGTQDLVGQMLAQFSIKTVAVDRNLAERAAALGARTNLKLPGAFALATAIDARHREREPVELASFDAAVLRAYEDLRSE